LSNNEISVDKEWKVIKLNKIKTGFKLYIHPDLPIFQSENKDFEIILLGYILNPYHASDSSSDILIDFATARNFDQITARTNTLNGRFVIIYNDSISIKIFNDAHAFREVFYTNHNNIIACGSTPNILAEFHNISKDEGKEINEFFTSLELNREERIWLGTGTIFSHVKHLLPNHYISLLENKVVRFWPVEKRQVLSLEDAANRMARILEGTFDSAVRHFDMHQGLTSGWDTKLLLAACRKHTHKIHFYFNRGFKSDLGLSRSIDYETASKISRDYDIPLEILETYDEDIDTDFEKIYYRNNLLARPKLLHVYFDSYKKGLDHTITVSGTSGNEILRLVSGINRKIKNSHQIAGLFGYQKYEYVVNEIQQWLEDSLYLEDLNYTLIDLFYWEQMFGNWGGLGGSEQDIAREELRPFNNRELISIYSSLKDSQRYKDYPAGHVYMIRLLWKELLDYPMDIPHAGIKKALRLAGLEQFCDKINSHFKQILH